jgi:hypothetical protein
MPRAGRKRRLEPVGTGKSPTWTTHKRASLFRIAQSGPPAPPVHPTEKITAETHCLDANGTPKLKSAAVRPGGGSTQGQTRPGLTTGAAPAESGQDLGPYPSAQARNLSLVGARDAVTKNAPGLNLCRLTRRRFGGARRRF